MLVNRVEPFLIEPLLKELQKECLVTLATIDYETGGPNTSTISWIYAKDDKTIRFAVESRSRIVENIQKNRLIAIHLIANESAYSITGEATVRTDKLENVPLKLALIEMKVLDVCDVMFYGAKIIAEPKFTKTYDTAAAERLDKQVMDAIKNSVV